jgi:hypothetical protein
MSGGAIPGTLGALRVEEALTAARGVLSTAARSLAFAATGNLAASLAGSLASAAVFSLCSRYRLQVFREVRRRRGPACARRRAGRQREGAGPGSMQEAGRKRCDRVAAQRLGTRDLRR